jgi:uncharacterized protein (DUF1015 family)
VPIIRPFQGVHFDPARTRGLSPVIGPPEDLPNLEEAERLVRDRPHHSLRLELGDPGTPSWGNPARTRYDVFQRWWEDGILVRSEEPVLYVHEHRFRRDGVELRRLGLLAAATIDDDPSTGFRPHEGTIPANLRYRTELFRNLKLSVTPIFTIIRDNGWLCSTLGRLIRERMPDLSGLDVEEGVHRVWFLRDRSVIDQLTDFVRARPLYIADGHHRYAAARSYRDELARRGDEPGAASSVLSLIVSEDDPGVSIFPIHREIIENVNTDALACDRADGLFDARCVDAGREHAHEAIADEVRRFVCSHGAESEFLVLRSTDRRLIRLRLRDWTRVRHLLDDDAAEHVQGLDATVLHRVLLEHSLNIDPDRSDAVDYVPDADAIIERVLAGTSSLGVFMRNPRLEQVLAVADAGAYMPRKSTYFYPKVPAGLVMYDAG